MTDQQGSGLGDERGYVTGRHPNSLLLRRLAVVATVTLLLVACGKDETTQTQFSAVDAGGPQPPPGFGGGVPDFDAGSEPMDVCVSAGCLDVGPPTIDPQCSSDSDCSMFVPALPQCTSVRCAADNVCEVIDDASLACDPNALPPPDGLLCKLSGDIGDVVLCPVRVARKHADVPGPVTLGFELAYPSPLADVLSAVTTPCEPSATCSPVSVPPAPLYPHGHTVSISPSQWDGWSKTGSLTIVPSAAQPTAMITDAYLTELSGIVGNEIVFVIEFQLNARLLVPAFVVLSDIVATGVAGQVLPTDVVDERIVVGEDKPTDPCDAPEGCPVVVPKGAICEATGNAGDSIVCPIGLVRATSTSAIPAALDFTLNYENSSLIFTGFQAYPCPDNNCDPVDVPPETLPMTGHSASLTPSPLTAWSGSGKLTLSSVSPEPLTEVYLTAGQPSAQPYFIEAVFQLTKTRTAQEPTFVVLSGATVFGGEGFPLVVSLLDNWIVVDGFPQCPWADSCGSPPDPPDVPAGSICAVTGAVGTVVDCEIRLAKKSSAALWATALQGILEYDPAALKFDNFYDTNCYPGIGCFEVPCAGPQAKPLSSGHSMATAPLSPSMWNGSIGMVIANISDPTVPLTDATLKSDGVGIQGDPLFALARFVIQMPLSTDGPSLVTVIKPLGSSAGAVSLVATIQDQVIITE